jgi:hypothetical protein
MALFYAIGDSQLTRKISAVCEINVFRVHNISSLDHVMSQINPIPMMFKSHLSFCLHLSSNLIHISVSVPTITYPGRPQTGRPIPITGRGFFSALLPRERLWGPLKPRCIKNEFYEGVAIYLHQPLRLYTMNFIFYLLFYFMVTYVAVNIIFTMAVHPPVGQGLLIVKDS